MKTLLTTALILFSVGLFSQTTPTPALKGNSYTFIWTANQTRTTNGTYTLPAMTGNYSWSLQYKGAKLPGRGVHDSIRYRVRCSNDSVAWANYPGLAVVVKKSSADSIFMCDPFGSAFKYMKFSQEFYAADTTKEIQMIWVLKQK